MRAFALRATHSDFSGGQVALPPDGKTLDVGERLKAAPDGVIVTGDEIEIAALEAFPALESVAVPAAKTKKAGDR